MIDDITRAKRCALHYRSLGYQPLPSRSDQKRPDMPSFAEYWDRPVPDSVYENWGSANIQLMCGAKWRLCVVDLDCPRASEVFNEMAKSHGDWPGTWIVLTGSGGKHVYFELPEWIDECPSRLLWGMWDTWGKNGTGAWSKHQEVRLLGDRSLVVAPPSVHVETGRRYSFPPRWSPNRMPRPAMAPDWLLCMPGVEPPANPEPPRITLPRAETRVAGPRCDRDAVQDAIPDKLGLARSWGLRTAANRPNANGWIKCHAIDRKDEHASASFKPETGVYWDAASREFLSIFDLAVKLGVYASWQDAVRDLGARYG